MDFGLTGDLVAVRIGAIYTTMANKNLQRGYAHYQTIFQWTVSTQKRIHTRVPRMDHFFYFYQPIPLFTSDYQPLPGFECGSERFIRWLER